VKERKSEQEYDGVVPKELNGVGQLEGVWKEGKEGWKGWKRWKRWKRWKWRWWCEEGLVDSEQEVAAEPNG
jgi:hypothetical protein